MVNEIELSHTLYLVLSKNGKNDYDTVQIVIEPEQYYVEFVFGMWEWTNQWFDSIAEAIQFLDKYRDRKDWGPKLEKLIQKMVEIDNFDWVNDV